MPDQALGTLAQWVAVGVTVLAVIVALLKDDFVGLWRKPKLSVRLALYPPDCHKTKVRWVIPASTSATAAASGQIGGQQGFQAVTVSEADCHYLRLWVENTGNVRAEQVQVFVAELSQRGPDGIFRDFEGFLPMNLKWAHGGAVFAEGISPKMGKHCDFGHLIDPASRRLFGEDRAGVPDTSAILTLDVEFPPNTMGHLIPPGSYRVKLLVAGSNTSQPVEKQIDFTFTGDWFADEKRMFEEGFSVV